MSAAVLTPPQCPERALSASPLPELRRLVVTATDDEVVITGRVSSYYLKQLAQESVRGAVAGRRLLNRVAVVAR